MTPKIILITILLSCQIYSQICNSEEKNLEDFNKVSKCSVSTKNSDDNTLKVNVKASGARLDKKSPKILEFKEFKRKLSSKQLKLAKRFNQVDEIPTFKACESKKGSEIQKCFNKEMALHVNKYFFYPSESIKNKIEDVIWVRFIIDEKGNVSNIKTLGSRNIDNKDLKNVVYYVISKLPTFKPGQKSGRAVHTKYGFPINFSLEQ